MLADLRKHLRGFSELRTREARHKLLENMTTGLQKKELKPHDFHLAECFQCLVPNGRAIWESMSDGVGSLQEGVTATDTAAFRYLTTGLFTQAFLQGWENPKLLWPRLVNASERTVAPRGRRIPGVARIGSANVKEGIGELEQYPVAGPAEVSIVTPSVKKFGVIEKISRETMIADPGGGQIMNNLQKSGDAEAYLFERFILKHALGIINTFTADFAGSDTTYNTYGTQANGISNIITSNGLTTLDALQNVKNRAYTQTNPVTGDLIDAYDIPILLVPHQLEVIANHLKAAGPVERVLVDSSNYTWRTQSANPYPVNYETLTSPLIYSLTSSATTWFAGDFKRCLYWAAMWDQEVTTRGMESEDAFSSDTFFQYKISRAGALEERDVIYIYKNTA